MTIYAYPPLQSSTIVVGNAFLEGSLSTNVNQFIFIDKVNVQLSATIFSSPVTINGNASPAPVSVQDGEYSINGGAYTSSPGFVDAGDIIVVRHTSSSLYNTPFHTILTVGNVSDRFTSYTIGKPAQIPSRAPRTRSINVRTLSTVLDGVERPYDYYRFSGGKRFFQKPNHSPFEDL